MSEDIYEIKIRSGASGQPTSLLWLPLSKLSRSSQWPLWPHASQQTTTALLNGDGKPGKLNCLLQFGRVTGERWAGMNWGRNSGRLQKLVPSSSLQMHLPVYSRSLFSAWSSTRGVRHRQAKLGVSISSKKTMPSILSNPSGSHIMAHWISEETTGVNTSNQAC